jgi:hypothetical protein
MLTGKELGKAIRQALEGMGLKPSEAAVKFGVKQPSVNGWYDTGAIKKGTLEEIKKFAAVKFGPEHWGLESEKPAGVLELPAKYQTNDRHILEVVRLMLATDEEGRILAKGAVRMALNGHVPAKQHVK